MVISAWQLDGRRTCRCMSGSVQSCSLVIASLPTVQVAEWTCHIKKYVKEIIMSGMTSFGICTGNNDVEPYFPFVVKAAQTITNGNDFVRQRLREEIGSLCFLCGMWSRLLWLSSPVLSRGFNDKLEVVARACCLIVDNLCEIVEYHAQVRAFGKGSV